MIVNDGVNRVVHGVKVKPCGCAIVLIESMGEYLCAFSLVFEEWSPYPFHFLVIKAAFLVLVVKSGEEPGVKTHICKDPGSCIGVAEGVNVPGYSWADSEFLHQEVVTLLHVVNKVIERGASLIRHAPSSIEELQTALLDNLAHLSLHCFTLLVPPHGEELHLYLGEVLGLVLDKFSHYIVNDKFHISSLYIVFGSREVLIHGFKPTNVIMRVWDDMYL
jgi:hypothetical protein